MKSRSLVKDSVTMVYNPNGSIATLQRNGMKNDGTFGAIDSLDITYDGNRLLKVTDDAETLNYNGALDFDDGDNSTCEYQYDNNGGLIYDSNRGINSITYDYSHHPTLISRTTKKKTIYYDYTPDGRKLSSTHISYIPNGNSNIRILTRDLYVDGLILRGGKPLMWQFGGGYVELNDNGTPTSWNYYITDHLGSTRMVVDSNDSIKENINYYPFGSEMRLENPALLTGSFSHPFRFTGKELDKLNSLNMYDFGARLYDVAGVPMWTSVDPLCGKYYYISPYTYCAGNPINMIDPDGCRSYNVIDADGNVRIETLDDGIDETYSIQECDFISLQNAYYLQQNYNDGQYDTFFNSLGLGTKGYEVACKARQLERETPNKYAYDSDAGDGDGFTSRTYKCNKFAYDVLTSTGVLEKVPKGRSYPQAKQYAGEKCIINGQFVSLDNYQPRLGDVIGGSYNFTDATGHVEIVTRTFPGSSKFKSTGAHHKGLGTTFKGV